MTVFESPLLPLFNDPAAQPGPGRIARMWLRGALLLTGLALAVLNGAAAWAADTLPAVVRIAVVAFPYGNKVAYSGVPGILDQEGWLEADLKARGVRLEWVPVSPQNVASTVNEAFANGSIDFADYGDLPSIILNAGGVETRLLAPGGRGSNVYLVVPANSTATSIADLKGKRIALHRGRPWEITFARLAAAHGLKLSDFKILNLNPQAGAAALTAGNADAYVSLFDGFPLVDRGIGKIIWSTKQAGEAWKMRAELWGAKTFVDKYPEIAQIVVDSHVRAAHWASQDAHQEEYIRITARTGQPESFTRREFLDDSVSWKDRWSPLFDDVVSDHYRTSATYARESGLIRRDVAADRLFEPRFLTAALKRLGLESYWTPVRPAATPQATPSATPKAGAKK